VDTTVDASAIAHRLWATWSRATVSGQVTRRGPLRVLRIGSRALRAHSARPSCFDPYGIPPTAPVDSALDSRDRVQPSVNEIGAYTAWRQCRPLAFHFRDHRPK